MRQAKIRRFKQEGGVGAVWAHRNLRWSAAAEADLELVFGRPGGWESGKRCAQDRGGIGVYIGAIGEGY
jgi:hypothetical protein